MDNVGISHFSFSLEDQGRLSSDTTLPRAQNFGYKIGSHRTVWIMLPGSTQAIRKIGYNNTLVLRISAITEIGSRGMRKKLSKYRPIVYAWWGHHPFKVENRVRLPVGWPDSLSIQAWLIDPRKRMKGETDKAPPEMVNQAKRAGTGLDWKGLFGYVPHVLTQTWWCEVNLRGPTGREGSLPQATGINAKG